jgi:hypothetical protein
MQNVRNSSVITYIKYLRISIAAPSCENMFNCARTFDLNTMILQRIKDYIYYLLLTRSAHKMFRQFFKFAYYNKQQDKCH